MTVLALDVGTSSCRASLYNERGRAVAGRAAHIGYAAQVTADGGAELDPRWLLDQVCCAIDQALSDYDGAPILAVGTSTFWHSLVGLDGRGEPITPVYLWLDARSRSEVPRLRAELDERAVHARTGCVLHWSYWPAKLRWLRRTSPDVFGAVRRWASFGELLVERLGGQAGVSVSMASGTGLLDTRTCAWDEEMLRAAGVSSEQLGSLVPLSPTGGSVPRSGELAARWPALRGVPWLPAVGDGACSNLGADCTSARRVALMIGTSGAERVVLRPSRTLAIPWGTWCYRVDEQRVVLGGALNDGGSLFDWLRRSLRLPAVRKAEHAVAAMEPDAHGLTVLPLWGGERSPEWHDDARGAIVGLRLHTTPEEMLRACMEAVALRFGELDRRLLEAVPGSPGVIATGGALLHSPAWMQMIADVLGRPVLASSEKEASSRGAALLALEAIGKLDQPLESLRPGVRRHFEPIAAHTARFSEAADRQRRLYRQLVAG